jgi:hypothetical protein
MSDRLNSDSGSDGGGYTGWAQLQAEMSTGSDSGAERNDADVAEDRGMFQTLFEELRAVRPRPLGSLGKGDGEKKGDENYEKGGNENGTGGNPNSQNDTGKNDSASNIVSNINTTTTT